MAEKDSSAIELTPEQTEKVVDGLNEKGAAFFTWEQLQEWLNSFGPDAKISDILGQIKAAKEREIKQ